MPVMMLVMFNQFASGLVLYWTLSSALGLAQQVWMDYRAKVQSDAEAVAAPAVVVRSDKKKHKG
jgi:membrane protein insertase Oxa1/YidC/SpoIIIJ